MNRKEFIKKGFLGSFIFSSSGAIAGLSQNSNDELRELEIIGFNHISNTQSKNMENMILHKADSRGLANHGWLKSHHTFSFANYYNPERMHFGVLRVLNDDTVQAGMGFGVHPHDNMEIISIPLEGDLEHKDSMGNVAVIKKGDIQVMSAGTGITHSEYNKNADKQVKFLQIWVIPNKRNVPPRYDQISLKAEDKHNRLQQILSPSAEDEGVWIHQNAWFHLGSFDKGKSLEYQIKDAKNGVYAFVLKGSFSFHGQALDKRDGMGIWDISSLSMEALSDSSEILLMEVPMSL
ncbi:MAG: pirin family protein [Bacteroidota bacterium]|jgi:redox-sensitive bicupin YhaK (pirin superfamily)